jgi:prevent-host-death family protein
MSATTQRMKISDVRSELNSLVNRVYRGETRVLVEKSGIPVAALVSPEDLARLGQFDAGWEDDFAVFDEMGAAFADVSPEEIERETAKALAEVRAEMQTERETTISR